MKQFVALIACLCITAYSVCSDRLDYEKYPSIEELILKETKEIEQTHPADYDSLAELYTSRGESYLLNSDYKNALSDFEEADAILDSSTSESLLLLSFRIIFGEVVCFDNLGMDKHVDQALHRLEVIVNNFRCDNYLGYHPYKEKNTSVTSCDMHSLIFKRSFAAVDPNEPQSRSWCEQTVLNTVAVLQGIAVNITSPRIRFSAMELIKSMQQKGLKCCYAGGLWSACVKPLADKFGLWNQKWKFFGITPDPAWDPDIK